MYTYKAVINEILTPVIYSATVDVGFGIRLFEKLKVKGVKIHNDKIAIPFIKELLEDESVLVNPEQQLGDAGKGCYLSDIILPNGQLVSEYLIAEGLGVKSNDD